MLGARDAAPERLRSTFDDREAPGPTLPQGDQGLALAASSFTHSHHARISKSKKPRLMIPERLEYLGRRMNANGRGEAPRGTGRETASLIA
jgi:hypothetical protein